MAKDDDEKLKRSQTDPAPSTSGLSVTIPSAQDAPQASTSNSAGVSRRSSLKSGGARTPRFDDMHMTEYFESSPTTPFNEDNDEGDEGNSYASSSYDGSPPASTTPTFNQSYNNLRRNLSMKSIRELELKHFQRAAWRKKNEPRKRPRTLEQLLVYAATGGARGLMAGTF
jgi:hypothetical protein